jgi:hypothetical protein
LPAQVRANGQSAGAAQVREEGVDEMLQALDQADALQRESGSVTTNDEGPAGIVPYTRGFNASLIATGQHDSSAGWASVLTPNVAFRFNQHWSVSISAPIYAMVHVANVPITTKKTSAGPEPTQILTKNLLFGDTTVAGGFEAHNRFFDYGATVAMGAPSGDDKHGLGVGQFTYNINNHFERPLVEWLRPELELGVTDSNLLNDQRVRKSYTTVGTDAHFQLGLSVDLPLGWNFTADAYEDLPVGKQTVTSTTTNGKKGKDLRTITTTREVSIGEDNGFLNTLDIPLSPRIVVSGFYNRSLRNKEDTAGVSLTFFLRARTPQGGPPHREGETTWHWPEE